MQLTLMTMYPTGIPMPMPRPVDLDGNPRRALGVVDGLLSVTQQQWAFGRVVEQRRQNPKVRQ